jgi:anti-sigma B factor antagonist
MDFAVAGGALGPGTYVIEPEGEIDLATAPGLTDSLIDAIDAGAKCVIVDLTEVGFVDSTGLGVLLSAQRRLQAGGGTLVTICSDPLVRRIFEVGGVMQAVHMVETRREATLEALAVSNDERSC